MWVPHRTILRMSPSLSGLGTMSYSSTCSLLSALSQLFELLFCSFSSGRAAPGLAVQPISCGLPQRPANQPTNQPVAGLDTCWMQLSARTPDGASIPRISRPIRIGAGGVLVELDYRRNWGEQFTTIREYYSRVTQSLLTGPRDQPPPSL